LPSVLVFDFDGTIVDSKRDITFALNKTLADHSLPPITEDEVSGLISVGVKPIIHKFASYPGIDQDAFWHEFLKIYQKHCLDHSCLYPQMLEVFKYYAKKTKVILSNKPQKHLDHMCKGLILVPKFSGIFGREAFAEAKPSPLPILEIAKAYSVIPDEIVMIGDTAVDIKAAKSAGAVSCGVLYGYGTTEELTASQPDFLVHSVQELIGLFD
jgi:phosphoglycolate phosphatase